MKILIADDDTITLRMLESTIKRMNYSVILATDGTDAWEKIQNEHPDIALLDWLMPGLEGLEIVQRLKTHPPVNFLYLILLTSNDRTEDITTGLDSGANDYITKPFDKDELRSRIAVGIRVVEYENRLERMNTELRKYSQEMEALAQERARQLVQADRMVTLGTMAAGIAHEINNPLTVVQGNIKLIRRVWLQDVHPLFQEAEQHRKFSIGSKPISDLLNSLEKSSIRMRNIIDGMRNFAHGKGGEVGILDLQTCVNDALEICAPKTKNRVELTANVSFLPFLVKGNAVQITQILVNLISNAADALSGTRDAHINISVAPADDHLLMKVTDNGPGIPAENIEKLWNPFYTTKPVGIGTGLGLFICKSIMDEHHGHIRVESTLGQGTVFILELPNEKDYDRLQSEKEAKSPTESESHED